MNRTHVRFAALLAALVAISSACPAHAALDPKFDPTKLTIPKLHPIPTVKPERYVMPNGIVVFLLEDHSLPVVNGFAYSRASSLWDPKDKTGLSSITGTVMRSGGTKAHGGDWLDDRLAAIGASIDASIGVDLGYGGFFSLTENAPEVLGLFADVLRRPEFPEDKIELAKVAERRGIASRNDEMIPLLQRVARQAVFGADSPEGRLVEYATLDAIQRDDLVRCHAQVFQPNRMFVAVYGDFKSSDMKKLLAAAFADWKASGAPEPKLAEPATRVTPRLVFAPKDDVTQSGIVVTEPGFRQIDPDYPNMDVMSQALGGGFQSRLFNIIRTQRGLAYAAGCNSGAGLRRPGVFFAYSLTKSESTFVAFDLLRAEVARATREPFSDDETRIARDSQLNSFVFNFEEPSQVLSRVAYYEMAGYPADFLQRYQKGLEAVTPATMLAATKNHIHPDAEVAIIVGKEKDFDRPLASAGLPVERVDITIPSPASRNAAAGPATPAQLAAGKALLRKAADLAGGAAAWAAFKTVNLEQDANVSMQGQSLQLGISVSWRLPDRMVITQKTPMGDVTQGFDGTNGWMKGFGQLQDVPASGLSQFKRQYETSFFRLFGHGDDLEVRALDQPRVIDGVSYRVATVKSDLVRDWTLLFAPDGTLARAEHQSDNAQMPGVEAETYGDWRAVGAIKYPFAQKVEVDGKPFMDGKTSSLKLDSPIDDAVFKKPAQ